MHLVGRSVQGVRRWWIPERWMGTTRHNAESLCAQSFLHCLDHAGVTLWSAPATAAGSAEPHAVFRALHTECQKLLGLQTHLLLFDGLKH